MILGILRETKKGENRVICTPKEVETITTAGHTVYAQRGCGERAGFSFQVSVQRLFLTLSLLTRRAEAFKDQSVPRDPIPGFRRKRFVRRWVV